MVFTFLKDCKKPQKPKKRSKEKICDKNVSGLQNLKYLLPGLLDKGFAFLWLVKI